jgi:hypothetical protein
MQDDGNLVIYCRTNAQVRVQQYLKINLRLWVSCVMDCSRVNLCKNCHTGCFFYFGMFDMLIIGSIFKQKSCFWTFFISTLCSYFVKKIGEKNFKTENFIQVFVKVPIFKIFEKISFFHFLIKKFIIFTNLRNKLKLFWYFFIVYSVCC